jgi:hypothetical protein
VVLFNNRTKDTLVQAGQRKELFDSIDSIMIDHQGRPFSEQIHHNINHNIKKNIFHPSTDRAAAIGRCRWLARVA